MKMITRMIFLCFMMLCFSSAYADAPVIDMTEVSKTIEMIDQLKAQIDQLKSQNTKLQEQVQSLTGSYGWGTYENSASEVKEDQEWSSDTWQDALNGMSGGNPSRYQQLQSQYEQANSTEMSQTDYAKGTSDSEAKQYDQQYKTNKAAYTTGSYAYGDIDKRMQQLQQLSEQIDNAAKNNDMKSATDLNSRILIQAAYLQEDMVRLQATMNQQMAQMGAGKLAEDKEISTFNQSGE